MKKKSSGMEKLIEMTQLSISLILPLILLLLLANWLHTQKGWGGWVYVVAFVLGIGTMGTTFYQFYRRHTPKKDNKPPSSFNRHE